MDISALLKEIEHRDPHHTHFQQAAESLLNSVSGYLDQHPELQTQGLLARLLEPERVIRFRVPWVDDQGQVRVNRAYRVQMNGALGPYKGGLRFHPSVNLDVLSFLALEQTIKNALTGLPLGAGKGGADFDPKGRSDAEIMRFCQAFMAEFHHHMGPDIDVPAGDMGVGMREVGYLFGMYRKLSRSFGGAFTGKSPDFGGSMLRPEATGYGVIYFLQSMLAHQDDNLSGKTVAVSGAGNVARHAAAKAIEEGAIVVTLSDSRGTVHAGQGLDEKHLEAVARIKADGGGLDRLADEFDDVDHYQGGRPWRFDCEVALPCATENELDEDDARRLVDNGCRWLAEGANMPCTSAAVAVFKDSGVFYAPGKAANAGGVAVSGLEMSQNSRRESWSASEVDRRLRDIMERIHRRCLENGGEGARPDYLTGASVAGFQRVARAMQGQGII
ncbi:NADP-specific glutamate dehydrogenase [Alloalcanivorax venustensis]|uniref:NADP-specific glutamate dehydrogenase n=2 Tax=Alloalcanivorax venustensis TaxID=172371 RepID=UPI00329A532B